MKPIPRQALVDPTLTRPGWVAGQPRDDKRLWLDKNENIDPQLAALTSSLLRDVTPESIFTYPETGPLYRKLAGRIGVPAENLLLTAGADGAIRAVFEAYVDPGDTVVHTVPSFAMYAVYSKMFGARAVTLDYQMSNMGPRLLAARVLEAISQNRPKAIFLPNPDSPTGTVFTSEDLREIILQAQEIGAVVLIDEAYFPFYPETVLPWVTRYPNLAVCRSTGKAWGLAGLRIGYVAASADLIGYLHKVRPMYEVNTVAVAMFDRLLDHEDQMLASVARLEQGKRDFLDAMRGLGLRTLPSHGNFVHVSFGPHADAVHAALSDLVLYRRDFPDSCLQGFSRISTAPANIMSLIIGRIRAVVEPMRKTVT